MLLTSMPAGYRTAPHITNSELRPVHPSTPHEASITEYTGVCSQLMGAHQGAARLQNAAAGLTSRETAGKQLRGAS